MIKKQTKKQADIPDVNPQIKAEMEEAVIKQQQNDMSEDIRVVSDLFFDSILLVSQKKLLEKGECAPTLYAMRLSGDILVVNLPLLADDQDMRNDQFLDIGRALANEADDVIAFAFASEMWVVQVEADKNDKRKPEEIVADVRPSTHPDRQEVLTVNALNALGQQKAYTAVIRRGVDLKVAELDEKDPYISVVNEGGWHNANNKDHVSRSIALELSSLGYAMGLGDHLSQRPSVEQAAELLNSVLKDNEE